MKHLYTLLVCALVVITYTSSAHNNRRTDLEPATCYGYSPCNACTNCSACKHCNAGGSCGICKKSNDAPRVPSQSSGQKQCKAITQKKTQCTRNVKSGSYCWQHQR
ncbi:MAG: hypothetical protein NVV59_07065 [Chitinophagaceae bacterium]|nr:hypothetical protein [Chitinophagaceae bacterium]